MTDCPDAPKIDMPGTKHRIGTFTRCDWEMEKFHRFLLEVQEFERGPMDMGMFVRRGYEPTHMDPRPDMEIRRVTVREYDALKRRSDAFLPLIRTLERALDMIWNRDMARLDALDMIDAITDLKRSKK